jgi:hypothetical protein
VRLDVLLHLHDEVPVALAQEPRPLLGLQDVEQHVARSRAVDVLDVAHRVATVHAEDVAARRLDRRRQLRLPEVAGLDLGLDERVHDAVDLPHEQGEEPDLRLQQDRLRPLAPPPVVRRDGQPLDREEPAGIVPDRSVRAVEAPVLKVGERGPLDPQGASRGTLGEPAEQGVARIGALSIEHGSASRGSRVHEGRRVLHRWTPPSSTGRIVLVVLARENYVDPSPSRPA